MSHNKKTFKVLLFGQQAVKEEFLKKYLQQIFREGISLTVGAELYVKQVQMNGDIIVFQFWDFSESEIFRFITQSYCKGADGAVLMYDINNSKTLDFLVEFIQIIKKSAGDIPIMLIGNKLDLQESREVTQEEGTKIAEKYNLSTFNEISTKTGQNVEETFEALTRLMLTESGIV